MVTLAMKQSLEKGSSTCQSSYRGKVYQFRNEEAQALFAKDPEYYIPVKEGHDPVVAAKSKEQKAGDIKFFERFKGRTYLFTNEKNRRDFLATPNAFITVDFQ